jgi:light-independent protochlorophyllide reductase subunit B
VKGLLYEMGIGINVVAPFDATPEDLTVSARRMSTS